MTTMPADLLRHPIRQAIVDALADGPASPVVIYRRLQAAHNMAIANGIPRVDAPVAASLGTVAYHVRTLVRHRVLVLDSETRVRGAVEHTYRLAAQTPADRRERAAQLRAQAAALAALADRLDPPDQEAHQAA